MGKSKNQKSKNVFKVSDSRSAKAKHKFKSLDAARLKNISVQNKQKIESIDQQLFALSNEIRRTPQPKTETVKIAQVTAPSKAEQIEKFKEMEKNCEQALEVLNSFKM